MIRYKGSGFSRPLQRISVSEPSFAAAIPLQSYAVERAGCSSL